MRKIDSVWTTYLHHPYLNWQDDYPRYKAKNILGGIDIVVIKVLKPFVLNKNVMPACLPTKPVKPGSKCFSSGWGTTSPFRFGEKVFCNSISYALGFCAKFVCLYLGCGQRGSN